MRPNTKFHGFFHSANLNASATPGIHSNETETFGKSQNQSHFTYKKKRRERNEKRNLCELFHRGSFVVDLTACTFNALANTIDALSRKKLAHKYQIQCNEPTNSK